MRGWRKMTWAIVIWTVLIAIWIASGASSISGLPAAGSDAEATGRAIGAGIGFTFIFFIWFVGFIVLAIIWFMTRPKHNVVVYGPHGQQVTVSEKEAKKRVDRQGWSYQQQATAPADKQPLP